MTIVTTLTGYPNPGGGFVILRGGICSAPSRMFLIIAYDIEIGSESYHSALPKERWSRSIDPVSRPVQFVSPDLQRVGFAGVIGADDVDVAQLQAFAMRTGDGTAAPRIRTVLTIEVNCIATLAEGRLVSRHHIRPTVEVEITDLHVVSLSVVDTSRGPDSTTDPRVAQPNYATQHDVHVAVVVQVTGRTFDALPARDGNFSYTPVRIGVTNERAFVTCHQDIEEVVAIDVANHLVVGFARRVFVDGHPRKRSKEPRTHNQVVDIANFSCDGRITATIPVSDPIDRVAIHPKSRSITTIQSGNQLTFSLPGPDRLYIEINDFIDEVTFR